MESTSTSKKELDNNGNEVTRKPTTDSVTMVPTHRYVCHNFFYNISIYEAELKWIKMKPDGTFNDTPPIVTPPRKKAKTNTLTLTQMWNDDSSSDEDEDEELHPPAYTKNKDILPLLHSFSKGFIAAILGLEDMFPETGEQATALQRRWHQNVLLEGIKEIQNCPIEYVCSMTKDEEVYRAVPTLRNAYFCNLTDNLVKALHYAIAYDISTEGDDPNYFVIVRHGKMDYLGEPVGYWLYGTECEDETKNFH